MEEIRTRVIYDYGRFDFEQDLLDYAGENTPLPNDEEWSLIQAGMQFAFNEAAWDIVRDSMLAHLNTKRVLGFFDLNGDK
jgi:hypothetical protein